MAEIESVMELERRVEAMLGEELSLVLHSATDALERLAPETFSSIGARALNLDVLVMHASAAAALPELMARFRVVASTRQAQAERYDSSDWAAEPVAWRKQIEASTAGMREIPQDRFTANVKESAWAR